MRVAAIDQGTTSTRCLVFEDGGTWQLAASRRHGQHYPQAGWVEQDPEELLENIRAVLTAAGPVDAIGLANQGESCLAWDAQTGKPLSPVISWQDARTAEILSRHPETAASLSECLCGLPLDPYFSASKLAWLLTNLPQVKEAQRRDRLRLGTTDAFFLDRLCGKFLTDRATASRTGLLDLATGDWSPELCQLHGVPQDCLPRIVEVDADFGSIAETPVKASIVDQQAALYGHGCRHPGDAKITFGTGAFMLAVAGSQRPETGKLLPTVGWSRREEDTVFAIEGGVYDAGSALEWVRSVGLYDAPAELNHFDGPSAISRGLVFVPALSGLAAPYWDRTAAPLFIGMNQATDRRDLVRAVLEGIAMLTVGLIEDAAQCVPLAQHFSVDGGLSQSHYFIQFLASASRRSISVPALHELTSLGLAELCGIAMPDTVANASTFHPTDFVTPLDHFTFANALNLSRGWRR